MAIEKGMPFTELMVRALDNGSKTQTRRLNGLEQVNQFPNDVQFVGTKYFPDNTLRALFESRGDGELGSIKCRYEPGNIIWVRETFHRPVPDGPILYKADLPNKPDPLLDHYAAGGKKFKWTTGRFMPRTAARLFLKVNDVSCERLQDMRHVDAIYEGIQMFTKDNILCKFGLDGWEWSTMPKTAKEAFMIVWDSINSKSGMSSTFNPWVWVYKFKKI